MPDEETEAIVAVGFAWNGRKSRNEQRGNEHSHAEGKTARIVHGSAPERAEVGRFRSRQENAHQKQEDNIHHHGRPMHDGDCAIVERQERNLHIEQQGEGEEDQREPGQAVEKGAYHAAAFRARDHLHEEEIIEFQPERVAALIRTFQHAQRSIELPRFAGQQGKLSQQPNVQQHQQDRNRHEEGDQPDLHLQQRQCDATAEQEVAMRDACDRDQKVKHQAEKDQPGHVGAAARRVDGSQQTVRIDRRLGIVDGQPGFVVHWSCRPRNLGAPATPSLAL